MTSSSSLTELPSSEHQATPSIMSSLATSTPDNSVKYDIDSADDSNIRMVAAVNVHRGDRIHAEVPLLAIPITPAGLYNPNTFYNAKSPHHGLKGLEQKIRALSPRNKKAIDALWSPPGTTRTAKVQCNAYESNDTTDSEELCVLRVYDHLSRINHSCRPNAMVDWNVNIEKGTLHALTDIPAGGEILISYLPKPRDSLKSRKDRKQEFSKSYHSPCKCESCGPDAREDADRQRALKSYKAASKASGIDDDASILIKVQAWNNYIGDLTGLMLFDIKLSEAYKAISSLHYQRASAALDLEDVTTHCTSCERDGESSSHIDDALAALTRAIGVDLRCLGEDHPDIGVTMKKFIRLSLKRRKHGN